MWQAVLLSMSEAAHNERERRTKPQPRSCFLHGFLTDSLPLCPPAPPTPHTLHCTEQACVFPDGPVVYTLPHTTRVGAVRRGRTYTPLATTTHLSLHTHTLTPPSAPPHIHRTFFATPVCDSVRSRVPRLCPDELALADAQVEAKAPATLDTRPSLNASAATTTTRNPTRTQP